VAVEQLPQIQPKPRPLKRKQKEDTVSTKTSVPGGPRGKIKKKKQI
jgi:hypothetical protein